MVGYLLGKVTPKTLLEVFKRMNIYKLVFKFIKVISFADSLTYT